MRLPLIIPVFNEERSLRTLLDKVRRVNAKVLKRGDRIVEIPMHYYPRGKAEGRKIRSFDGVEAMWTLLKYRPRE